MAVTSDVANVGRSSETRCDESTRLFIGFAAPLRQSAGACLAVPSASASPASAADRLAVACASHQVGSRAPLRHFCVTSAAAWVGKGVAGDEFAAAIIDLEVKIAAHTEGME